jgi:GntR family transcriptional regulator
VLEAGLFEARLLGIARGAPLVSIVRTAWTQVGAAFEHSHDLFRGDRVRIVVRARAAAQAPGVVAAAVQVR